MVGGGGLRCLSFRVMSERLLCLCRRKEGHIVDDTSVLLECGGGAIVSCVEIAPDIVLFETKTGVGLFHEIVSEGFKVGLSIVSVDLRCLGFLDLGSRFMVFEIVSCAVRLCPLSHLRPWI